VHRMLWVLPILLIVTFFVFVLLDLAPGDAAESIAGPEADAQTVANVRTELGLDKPLIERYTSWVGDVAHGDLQNSLVGGRPVRDMVTEALPATLSLASFALVVSIALAFVLGAAPSVWRHPFVDRLCTFVAAFCLASPTFWIALLLASTLAVDRHWFPALGYVGITEDVDGWFSHLVLPGLALGLPAGGELARQLRGALVSTLASDYVLAARARGLSNRKVVLKHGMKNSAVPVVTVLGVRVAQILGGAVIIEQIFVIDGLGKMTVNAVLSRDMPVVLGIVFVATAVVLLVNLAIDGSYGYFNPKVRSG
jgi:peptide/nickel transport system permease protein